MMKSYDKIFTDRVTGFALGSSGRTKQIGLRISFYGPSNPVSK